jgi:integrase
VSVILELWLEDLKKTTSSGHHRQQESIANNWIIPTIGHKRIGSITHKDLQDVIDTYYVHGNNGNGASKKSLMNLRSCLAAFMKYCRSIPCSTLVPEFMKIPRGAKPSEKKIATADDLRKLFSSDRTKYRNGSKRDFYINLYRFAVVTGLRPGEIIALQNKDIQGEKLTICRSINDKDEVTRGKNDNARRTIILPRIAIRILEDQKNMLKQCGLISQYVFPRSDGSYIPQEKLRIAWGRYREFNGIEGAKTPYEMRHTFVSVADEMPLSLEKMVVGHSENMDTDGVYGHQKAGDLSRAAAYMDDAFSSFLEIKK